MPKSRARSFYSFGNILSAVTTPLTTFVPQPVRPVAILIPLAYIFLMLRRIFGQKIWLLTWANGHWG